MCHGCYCTMMKSKKALEDGRQYQPSVEVFTWKAHSPSQCPTCEHFENAHAGGRPKKQKRPGRPATIGYRSAIDHIKSVSPPSFFPPGACESVATKPECDPISTDLLCQLCHSLLDRPVQLTTCNNLVCMTCLCEWLEERAQLTCPCCNSDHIREFKSIVHPSAVVTSILGNHKVTCTLCSNIISSGTPITCK